MEEGGQSAGGGGPRAPAVGREVETPGPGDKRLKSSPSCFSDAGVSGLQSGVHRTVLHRGRGSPALTKASGSGPVYMMHSSQEHQAPGRLPCSSSRKEGGGPRGQTGDTEELEAAVPPGSHRPRTMGPHWVPGPPSGVQAPAAQPVRPPRRCPQPSCSPWRAGPCSLPGSWGHQPRDASTSVPQPPPSCPAKGWWPPEQHGHPDPRALRAASRPRVTHGSPTS